jgi:hypothetical protein
MAPVVNSIPFYPVDLTKTPEQLVVDLINTDNGTSFNPGQLVFGAPTLNPVNSRRNSKVRITAADKSYFTGSTIINYNRIDFDAITYGKSRVFQINTATQTKISDLIPAIDERFSLRLTPNDYIDGPIPVIGNLPNEEDALDLVAAPQSLVFINKLTLQVERLGGLLLSSMFNSRILNGLNYTVPLETCPVSTVY